MRGQLCLSAIFLMMAAPALAENRLVQTQAEYFAAAKSAKAGDTITLANGEWRDFEIVLTGSGTADKPITLISQDAGKVVLTGKSNLRIGGSHIFVTGLVFRDGYSPTGEVVSFRRSKDDQAHDSRVTEIVIDGFSKPNRYEDDYWVGIYGKNNRFDHNHIAGKTNKGVTLAVRLDSEGSRENRHRIDHNYFGERPVLGSNGGETIRVGTSQYSMYDSLTRIDSNYFEHCDGEVEIISIKSGKNVVSGNVFDASEGAVTLRHGDGNLVERNVFLGRGKGHTGGIRVINRNQTVLDNYMEGLRGTGFTSALTVMNGVPNSPVNRYVQVSNATIANNTIVDASRITLGAGADTERSAPPIHSKLANNVLGGTGEGTFIEVDADVSGLALSNNLLVAGKADTGLAGLATGEMTLERASNGLLYPIDPALADVGAPRDLQPVARDATGPKWYAKPGAKPALGSGRTIRVSPGEGTLEMAVSTAAGGDVLALAAGRYLVEKTVLLDRPLTISGPAKGSPKATIAFARPTLFEIGEGGNLALANVTITGEESPDNVGNAVIRTTAIPIRGNFMLSLDGVTVRDLTINRGFDVIVVGKGAFANSISIDGSTFSDISGAVVRADAETDDYGQYGVEHVRIAGSTFRNVGQGVAVLYRGGKDESTFGPHFLLSGSTIEGSGNARSTPPVPSLSLHGVQDARIEANTFARSGPLRIVHTVGEPETVVAGNTFDAADFLEAIELDFKGAPRVELGRNVTR